MRNGRLLALVGITSLACAPSGEGEGELGPTKPPCRVEVSPPRLNFGVVDVNRATRRAIEIRNLRSDATCTIVSGRFIGAPNALSFFDVPGSPVVPEPTLIPPGAALAVPLGYGGGDGFGTFEIVLRLELDRAGGPTVDVPLTATRSWPDRAPAVTPDRVDFGGHLVGCGPQRRAVRVINPHDVPLRLTFELETDGAFLPLGVPGAARTLAPRSTLELSVGFVAVDTATRTGTLHVAAGPSSRVAVPLRGRGAPPTCAVDRWVQALPEPVDILFYVDDAPDLLPFVEALRANLDDFAAFAAAQALNARVALATRSADGRLLPLGPDGAEVLAVDQLVTGRELSAWLPDRPVGPDDHRTLDTLVEVLQTGPFAPSDARLSVIVVTPAEDASPGGVDFFAAYLRSVVGYRVVASPAHLSVIAGGHDGCASPLGVVESTPRLSRLAERLLGVDADLCTSDWSRTLEDLSRQAFGFKSRHFLTRVPVIDSMRVFVDDAPLPGAEASGRINWTYDARTNSLNFTPLAVPAPGQRFRAEYTAACP